MDTLGLILLLIVAVLILAIALGFWATIALVNILAKEVRVVIADQRHLPKEAS
ncbi:hypothetical protein HOU03_gp200 [Caulobacter phage CcrSC]|uniref:Uncharacterized protein n=1 Tax=Caulobacter phage CcrSC TaxID=2283272 RepID=A0A385EGM6_9CAUD|nr:hypothetical protein HOU03_gp200 [Caulobacter phage CcrSC]AXQ70068.1 hypothetical protein CcrSC_gp486 [Caulobacter phage CcrSC]